MKNLPEMIIETPDNIYRTEYFKIPNENLNPYFLNYRNLTEDEVKEGRGPAGSLDKRFTMVTPTLSFEDLNGQQIQTVQGVEATVAQVRFLDAGLSTGDIALEANVEISSESTLLSVQFYVDGNEVGSDSITPYIARWNPNPGFFSVWSVAIDDMGNKYCSDL